MELGGISRVWFTVCSPFSVVKSNFMPSTLTRQSKDGASSAKVDGAERKRRDRRTVGSVERGRRIIIALDEVKLFLASLGHALVAREYLIAMCIVAVLRISVVELVQT